MAKLERDYIVPLRRKYANTPRYKRSKKAVTVLREFLVRHLKTENVKIGQYLNEFVWARGIRHPPSKVAVHAIVDEKDGVKIAQVELQGKAFKESVRPDEKAEQATGLKGKLQDAVGTIKGDKGDKKKDADGDAPKPSLKDALDKAEATSAKPKTEKPKAEAAPKKAAKPKTDQAEAKAE